MNTIKLRAGMIPFVLSLSLLSAVGEPPPIPDAPGPYLHPDAASFGTSFTNGQRLVGTYYFYWYDEATKSHVVDDDGSDALTTHPKSLQGFSYKQVAWHRAQLLDMMEAGIDFLLPVFWGAPSEQQAPAPFHWSYEGLPPLVQAREELLAQGKTPPRIGLFYDTSTLQYNRWHLHIDCTTDYGHQWFYATIRDFFSLIPPRHWAMLEGHPIVLLYSAAFAKAHDQAVIDYARTAFARDFSGKTPYIGREISWNVRADNIVAWGGALGMKNPGIGSVGPGYDHSAVPGRAPLVVARRNGQFYEENWLRLLRRPPSIVMVETWNEFHEGTDICESREYGRQYIELTRRYADLFRQGWRPPWPPGPYTGASTVAIEFSDPPQERGLRLVRHEDGRVAAAQVEGQAAFTLLPGPGASHYLYLRVDDSFKTVEPMDVVLEVRYWDGARGSVSVDYDGSDRTAPLAGAYTRAAESIPLNGEKKWKTARIRLPNAIFLNAQNSQADLRLATDVTGLAVQQVRLLRGS